VLYDEGDVLVCRPLAPAGEAEARGPAAGGLRLCAAAERACRDGSTVFAARRYRPSLRHGRGVAGAAFELEAEVIHRPRA
jgi:hypothetical protein